MRKVPVQRFFFSLLIAAVTANTAFSQTMDRCGTMQVLQQQFDRFPALQNRFQARELQFRQKVAQRLSDPARLRTAAVSVTVPVVFHIVLTDPNVVSDAQILAQIDTLNKDYAGLNGDSVRIPLYFKPLFAKTGIRFALARRTPEGETTTGIIRKATTTRSFGSSDNNLKHTSAGGEDAWNTEQYLNVWITNLANGVLGYATFPEDSVPDEQGIVIMYTSLPGGSALDFNRGKTLTHEIGHYFDLFHIWGDDNGSCSGTDFVDDTPNQANSTVGCPDSIKTDNCTPVAPGVMYQNYMDYSGDVCLVMFTNQQAARMEAALATYRASLFNSLGAVPLVRFNRDAELRFINNPTQRACSSSFAPAVTIRNLGMQPLTSLTINISIDNGPATATTFTGNIPMLGSSVVTLNTLTVSPGSHVLNISAATPNGGPDEYTANNVQQVTFMYSPPVSPPLTESFEGNVFPPPGWDIINQGGPDTWQQATGVATTGNTSAVIRNFNNSRTGERDYLRLPQVAIGGTDSAFLIFNVAAAAYTPLNTANNNWDTLEVLLSTDCGNTYTSLYKKWGASLVTRSTPTVQSFVPAANEWRRDSINITPFIGNGNVILAFKNTNGNENNIYLDDIRVYTVYINPNLKAKGYLVTPNPTSGLVNVQFYPQPVNLRGIAIYSATGQQMDLLQVQAGRTNNRYTFNLSRYPAGIYFVKMVFSDRVLTSQIMKF